MIQVLKEDFLAFLETSPELKQRIQEEIKQRQLNNIEVELRPELAELIIEMQLAVQRDTERSLTFLVPAEKTAQFHERLTAFSGVVKEFGDTESLKEPEDERIMVFFE